MRKTDDLSGCWTALATPFTEDRKIDWKGLEKNLEFQVSQGIKGVVPVGTTGESPTLTTEEHKQVIAKSAFLVSQRIFVLAGSGSNSTEESIGFARAAQNAGCDGILLVDCYYNGPSSLELREEYYGVISSRFPKLIIVPYIIPGRTGCALSPEDLAILSRKHPNVMAVKEATGDLERMRRTRQLVPKDFQILSGDDDKTFAIMTDSEIKAGGAISVVSNIAPAAVQRMCKEILGGNFDEANKIKAALEPLFKIVTVVAAREVDLPGFGIVELRDKFRNPVPIKTAMTALGMPAGPCRRPLGKMSKDGVEQVKNALRAVWEQDPEILAPIEAFYGVNISERLENDKIWEELTCKE